VGIDLNVCFGKGIVQGRLPSMSTTYHLRVRDTRGTETVVSVPAPSLETAWEMAERQGWSVLAQADAPPGRRVPSRTPADTLLLGDMTRPQLVNAIAWGVVKGFALWTALCVLVALVVGVFIALIRFPGM